MTEETLDASQSSTCIQTECYRHLSIWRLLAGSDSFGGLLLPYSQFISVGKCQYEFNSPIVNNLLRMTSLIRVATTCRGHLYQSPNMYMYIYHGCDQSNHVTFDRVFKGFEYGLPGLWNIHINV